MPAPKGHPPYNKNGEGGRPKKYTDDFIEKEADAFEEWMTRKTSLWYEDFAMERGYNPSLLSEWAKKNERFSAVYRNAKSWQQSLLIRGGLSNKFNAGFTKFVMGNVCGWYEKQLLAGDATNPIGFLLTSIDGKTKDLIEKEGDEQS